MDVRYEKGKLQHYDQNDKKWYDVGSGVGSGDFAMNQNYDVNATDLVIPGCVEYVKDYLYYTSKNYPAYYTQLNRNSSTGYYSSTLSSYPQNTSSSNIGYVYGKECVYSSLRHVTFEEGVKQIGYKSFSGQNLLDRIDFPESLEWVHPDAFSGTAWYTNQPYGPVYCGNVLYTYKFTPDNDFFEKDFIIKNGTKSISSNFIKNGSNVRDLNSVVVPDSLIGIGDYAFYNVSAQNFSINLPDSITWIGKYAFRNSKVIIDKLPKYLTGIQQYAFYSCLNLTEITIPASVELIEDGGFGYCRNLTSITFEENSKLKKIGNSCFSYINNINEIRLPEGLNTIDNYAFEYSNIGNIYIPASLKFMNTFAFRNCGSSNLTNIEIGNNFNANLYLSYCQYLTKESLEAMIDNLADRTGQTSRMFNVGSGNLNKISEEKKDLARSKNWSLS